jgi:lysozyme
MSRARIVAGAVAISAAGVLLIQGFEGERFCAYPDPATRGAPWTIGYGHTGPEVKPGLCISKAKAEAYLMGDIRIAQTALAGCVRVPVSQTELDGLTGWTMNIGGKNACSSTLVRKLNAYDYAGAAGEFPRWINANGKPMAGLIRRRKCEQSLFLTPPDQPAQKTAEAVKACIIVGDLRS